MALMNETSAAARILQKDYQQRNILAVCELDSIENKMRLKRR